MRKSGDTVKFVPDTPALVETLPRQSGRAPKLNARGISVRLEGIDALETHQLITLDELRARMPELRKYRNRYGRPHPK